LFCNNALLAGNLVARAGCERSEGGVVIARCLFGKSAYHSNGLPQGWRIFWFFFL